MKGLFLFMVERGLRNTINVIMEREGGDGLQDAAQLLIDTVGDDVYHFCCRLTRNRMEKADRVMEKLPKGQALCSLDTVALCLDGKVFDCMGGMGNGGRDYVYRQFDKVLNLEKVTGTRVAGKYIDLKSVPYDTVK